ncbi:MAG: hypothetical protein UU74_C0033G0020 [Candidatus Woesebacteria bacterium GW2011_GWA1_41_7]|uniref:Uncharacterized protein n=1 Tax=Candidatus Woesebacteria bacterium GW2011_GWA1_41_7 TaxID=1618556 RepID=A0A0G0ZUR9_9BACT|nr:MAG: hypothetical protein UU74_C0033G0020 [Candidatus Woesebacteria bacterium GW2011_GWA1_41_7]
MADLKARKQSDVLWVRASIKVAPADGTHVVCPIPANTLVEEVKVYKSVAFTAAGSTLKVGFTGNKEVAVTDYFMTSETALPGEVGMVSSFQGKVPGSGGKYFTHPGNITITTNDNGGTAGTLQVFVKYAQVKN